MGTHVHDLSQRLSDIDTRQQQSSVASDQRFTQYNTDVRTSLTQILAAQQRFQLNLDVIEATNIARLAESTAATAMPSATPTQARLARSSSNRQPHASTIQISATTAVYHRSYRCKIECTCSCHNRKIAKLRLLNRFLGFIFVGYVGLPYASPKCDDRFCERAAFR